MIDVTHDGDLRTTEEFLRAENVSVWEALNVSERANTKLRAELRAELRAVNRRLRDANRGNERLVREIAKAGEWGYARGLRAGISQGAEMARAEVAAKQAETRAAIQDYWDDTADPYVYADPYLSTAEKK